jgi:pimeloyl-ACP methyl ester carboxylesterase
MPHPATLQSYGLVLIGTLIAGQCTAEAVRLAYQDLTLNANLSLAPGGALSDGVVLITHGTQAHAGLELMRGLQAGLQARGRHSLAITLSLGLDDRHGLWSCDTPSRYRHEDAIGEIGAWVDWLEARGAKDLVLMGHSRGASQSLWYTAEHSSDNIRSLVLLAPGLSTRAREIETYRKRFDKDLLPVLTRAQRLVTDGRGDTLLEDVPFLVICPQTSVSASAFVSFYADDPRRDTPYWLSKVTKPTLIINGSEDTMVPELPERVQPYVDGERVQLETIDMAGHFFRDLNLEDALDAAVAFIDSVETNQRMASRMQPETSP